MERQSDSLAKLTRNQTDLGYDSIVRATISYAKELDSLNIATGRSTSALNFLMHCSPNFLYIRYSIIPYYFYNKTLRSSILKPGMSCLKTI